MVECLPSKCETLSLSHQQNKTNKQTKSYTFKVEKQNIFKKGETLRIVQNCLYMI
jgi:hypothetical protein